MEKLCIDVKGFSEEKKKRVQDAFFELGFEWYTFGKSHRFLHANKYTNIDLLVADRYLMHSSGTISHGESEFEITYPELMRKAGMDESDPDELNERKESSDHDIQEIIESYLDMLDTTSDPDARAIIKQQLTGLTYLQFERLGVVKPDYVNPRYPR